MHRSKAVPEFDRDLKEAISSVRRDQYRRTLAETRDPAALDALEHTVRTDFQLTRDDRAELLGDIDSVTTLAS